MKHNSGEAGTNALSAAGIEIVLVIASFLFLFPRKRTSDGQVVLLVSGHLACPLSREMVLWGVVVGRNYDLDLAFSPETSARSQ